MAPKELLIHLVKIFPEFQVYWDSPKNYFCGSNGEFTLHGVFAEFTHFFKENHSAQSDTQIEAFGKFVSECMAPADDSPLGNATATCFVENIAGEPCARKLSRYLTGESRRYWQAWSGCA
jgi:hypothetical protein